MPIEKTEKIWMDGELVPWDEARVHVLTHSLHYGSGVFEGIRTYSASDGPAVFRLTDHIQRLFDSAKLIMMEIPWTRDQLVDACKLTVRESGLDSCYVRPIAFLGYGEIGLNPLPCEVNVSIAVWPWGAYLGEESLEAGVRMKVSSWRRMDPNVNPVAAKGTGIYINSSLAKVEAVKSGYDEAILLNTQGYVAECTGENLFIVKDGVLITPPLSSGALAGITRDSIMTIARDLGVPVKEEQLLRHDLYLADEAFLTGTAAEVVPIRSVDDREIGNRGEITRTLQETYFAAVRGEVERYKDWLEYVR
ncbi:MAG: branched-chain amino acid aminotransferase [Actinomycetota bacterium]|nr:branched-chain amino acid aminotransferase [Actinomycetota bacterium]